MFLKKLICSSLKSTYHFSSFQEIRKSKGFKKPFLQKRKKRNVFREAYSFNPKVHLLFQKNPEGQSGPKSHFYKKKKKKNIREIQKSKKSKAISIKKKEKRMLEMFLKKFYFFTYHPKA